MKTYDAIIIGAGVAGMTAAIYLKRANLNVLIIEKSAPGGQVNHTDEVCNYPGFIDISGPALASNIFMQIHKLGVELVIEEALEIKDGELKTVVTSQNTYLTKKIIIASGRKPRHLGLANEEKLSGRGISWCATCDGPLYKEKNVVVVGGGNTAIEESIYLSAMVNKLYLVHRSEEFRADPISLDKLHQKDHVEVKVNSELKEYIMTGDKLSAVKIYNNQTTTEEIVEVDGVFICIGYEPHINLLKSLNITNNAGYIEVDNEMRTKIKGVYACGDNIIKTVYQIATAIGEGALAATTLVHDFHKE